MHSICQMFNIIIASTGSNFVLPMVYDGRLSPPSFLILKILFEPQMKGEKGFEIIANISYDIDEFKTRGRFSINSPPGDLRTGV